jgi:hypothetical protein
MAHEIQITKDFPPSRERAVLLELVTVMGKDLHWSNRQVVSPIEPNSFAIKGLRRKDFSDPLQTINLVFLASDSNKDGQFVVSKYGVDQQLIERAKEMI